MMIIGNRSFRFTSYLSILFVSTWLAVDPWCLSNEPSADRFVVYPESISLSSSRSMQSVVALVVRGDGSTADVTAASQAQCDEKVAKFVNEALVPISNGKTTLRLTYGEFVRELSVEVRDVDKQVQPGFRNHIVPIFTKAGCNTGKCHGAASGKDGFRLSLFGYDPEGDHYRLTREIVGRRINLADPEHCLLVNKALGMVPHTGGGLLDEGDANYSQLIEWLRSGAPADPSDAAVPTSIAVYPSQVVFSRPNELQKLIVIANYSDGTVRDVSQLAVYLSNNESTATVNQDGMVQATGPGSAFVMARFDQFTEGASLVVRPGTPFEFPALPENNYIDRMVYNRLRDLNILPSELTNDEQFVRRVTLDLVGRLPTPADVDQFTKDSGAEKRAKLVDALIKDEDFKKLWIMHWAELLQIRTNNGMSPKALSLYDLWLRKRVLDGQTIDHIVQELLPASGGTFSNPATNYFQTETSPQLMAESVAQVFLGTRIQCAQCHNHPFDRWTMDDYYGFANFFSQIGYKPGNDPRELTIYNLGEGEIKHPVAGRKVVTKFLGGDYPRVLAGADSREPLAKWLTSRENPAFARNIANIVWSHFFGQGIIDPIDDFRVSNPPSNPELLEALAGHLIEYQFDVGKLAADICKSRTYQLSVATNNSNQLDQRHFSHAKTRRLRAEVLLDCLVQVTGAPERLPNLPPNSRAIEVADGQVPNYFLSTFGRSTRATPCSCEVKTNPTLSQALHLLNGEATNGKIHEGRVIPTLIAELREPQRIAIELYRLCYARSPKPDELSMIEEQLRHYPNAEDGLKDLFWALLNSNEFVFNH